MKQSINKRCTFCKELGTRCPHCQLATARFRAHEAAQDVAALKATLAAAEQTLKAAQREVLDAGLYAEQWAERRQAQRDAAAQSKAAWANLPGASDLVKAVCQGVDSNLTQFQR